MADELGAPPPVEQEQPADQQAPQETLLLDAEKLLQLHFEKNPEPGVGGRCRYCKENWKCWNSTKHKMHLGKTKGGCRAVPPEVSELFREGGHAAPERRRGSKRARDIDNEESSSFASPSAVIASAANSIRTAGSFGSPNMQSTFQADMRPTQNFPPLMMSKEEHLSFIEQCNQDLTVALVALGIPFYRVDRPEFRQAMYTISRGLYRPSSSSIHARIRMLEPPMLHETGPATIMAPGARPSSGSAPPSAYSPAPPPYSTAPPASY